MLIIVFRYHTSRIVKPPPLQLIFFYSEDEQLERSERERRLLKKLQDLNHKLDNSEEERKKVRSGLLHYVIIQTSK